MADSVDDWLPLLRRVIEELAGSDVSELELAEGELRIRLRRLADPTSLAAEAVPTDETTVGSPIGAPFTGIFYRAPTPTTEPYVREGDWVEVGAIVGLIETMKIFNEVRAEQAGQISRLVADNGQLVQAGDPLMLIAPGERPAEPPT